MKKTFIISTVLSSLIFSSSNAQSVLPETVEPQDVQLLEDQAAKFGQSLNPVVANISKSVVSIQVPGRRSWQVLAMGTVTDKGILTKWSEIKDNLTNGLVVYPDKPGRRIKVIGVYEEYDLALLSDDIGLPTISLDSAAPADLGDFVVMSGSNGANGFGVVSVKPRSLREEDRAFLGVLMDFQNMDKNGVLLQRIEPDTGASRAGLLKGDKLLSIDGKRLGSAMETRSIIMNLKPAQEIEVEFSRGENKLKKTILLGARPRPENVAFPPARLRTMEKMGGPVSEVRDNFPNVIQTDMKVKKNTMGAPVVDLEGRLVGVSLSRSRIKTHLIPTENLKQLLTIEPVKLKPAVVARNIQPEVGGELQLEKELMKQLFGGGNGNDMLQQLFGQAIEEQEKMFGNRNLIPNGGNADLPQIIEELQRLRQNLAEMEKRIQERR